MTLSGYRPGAEEKNTAATQVFQGTEKGDPGDGVTILAVHHLRKPSTKSGEEAPYLEDGDVKKWFLQARSARSLINASDVRVGIDVPGISSAIRNQQNHDAPQVSALRHRDGEAVRLDRLRPVR
jgi:hypothetical protein